MQPVSLFFPRQERRKFAAFMCSLFVFDFPFSLVAPVVVMVRSCIHDTFAAPMVERRPILVSDQQDAS